MLLKIVTLLTLFSLARASSFPTGYTYEYTYEGDLITGTKEPAEYFSYTRIKSEIHVLNHKDTLWIRIVDATYTIYSGSESENNANAVPLPQGSSAIDLPFGYRRYENSSSPGILVTSDDKPWSMNMKQAIANLFYLDDRVFKTVVPESFDVDHDSYDRFNYFVLPNNDANRLEVVKITSGDYYKHSKKDGFYDEKYQSLPMSKRQTYDIEAKDGKFIINSISSLSNIDYHPFVGNGAKVYVLVNQTLHLKLKRPFDQPDFKEPTMEYKEIALDSNAYLMESGVYDVVAGRYAVDMDQLVVEVKKDLEELEHSMNETHITLSKSELNNPLDFLMYRLRRLEKDHIIQLCSELSEYNKQKHLLLKILALTGTPSSYSVIVDLILDKTIDEEFALQLLQTMSNNILKFPEDLYDQFLKLTSDDIPQILRHHSVLTIASMISISTNHFGPKEYFEEFVDHIIEKLKESKDEMDLLLYVSALGSIQSPKSDTILRKIVKNISTTYKYVTPHLRATAMLGLKRSQEQNKILWLIVMNKHEHFEVRATAISILMDPEYPTDFEKSFWILYKEEDYDLKQLLYHILTSISQTALPRYEVSCAIAKRLLPYVEEFKLNVLRNFNLMFDFLDESFLFESMGQITAYGDRETNGFTTIHVQLSSQNTSPTWSKYEHYIYIDWKSDEKPNKLTLAHFPKYVEWVTIKNGRVLSRQIYGTNFIEFPRLLEEKLFSRTKTPESIDIDLIENAEIVLPTDIGVPVIFYNRYATMKTHQSQTNFYVTKNFLFNLNYRSDEVYGFSSYNPVSNSWIGVRRIQSANTIIPIHIKLSKNPGERVIKFTYKVPEKSFGFESYVYSEVYLRDTDKGHTIKASCPDCKLRNVATSGEDNLKNFVFLEDNNENATLQYKLAVFDCEDHLTASYPAQLLDIYLEENMNYETAPIFKPLIAAYHLWKYMSMSPRLARCGFGLKVERSNTNPAAIVNFILSAPEFQIKFEEGNIIDFYKEFPIKLEYQVSKRTSGGYEIMKKQDLNFMINQTNEVISYFNISSFWRKTNVPHPNFCMEVWNNWVHEAAFGAFTFSMGKEANKVTGDECPKDGPSVALKKRAEMSEEQKQNSEWVKAFHTCNEDFNYCIRKVSSYRWYQYHINYANFNKDQAVFWTKMFDYVKLGLGQDFVRIPYPDEKVNPGNAIVTVTYPLYFDTVNVIVITENEAFRFDDVPIENWSWIPYVNPQSAFLYNGDSNILENYCEVGIDYIRNLENGEKFDLNYKNDWVKLISEVVPENPRWVVKVKKDKSDNLVLHMRVDKEVIEVTYKEDIEIHIDNELVPLESKIRYRQSKWMDYMMVPEYENKKKVVIVHVRNVLINVAYDRNTIRMSVPDGHFKGACQIW